MQRPVPFYRPATAATASSWKAWLGSNCSLTRRPPSAHVPEWRRACAFYDVLVEDARIGVVVRGSHPRTDTFKDRERRIRGLVEEARKTSGEPRQALVEKGYEELRGACELVVEKDILKGVTERYRPNVRMTMLDQIRADRLPAAVRAIQPLFDKCSRVIASHSQPLATLGVRPVLEELEQDWQGLQKARKEYLEGC